MQPSETHADITNVGKLQEAHFDKQGMCMLHHGFSIAHGCMASLYGQHGLQEACLSTH